VQTYLAKDVRLNNVAIAPGSGAGQAGSVSIVAGKNVMVSGSEFTNGSYLECLGCWGASFVHNVLDQGQITFDGGTQNSLIGFNSIIWPRQNANTPTACIYVLSYSQFDRIVGNNCVDVRTSQIGIDITGQAGEGGHIVTGNTISTVDATTTIGISLANSNGDTVTGNTINQAAIGINFNNSTGDILSANQMANVSRSYSFPAGVNGNATRYLCADSSGNTILQAAAC
jgi:parallel beta-helix repeat protein